jgi:hypothetical protein
MKISLSSFLLKNAASALALFLAFVILSYLFRPTQFLNNRGSCNGIIESIEYKQESTWARTAGSKGYIDFFEIKFEGDNGKKYRNYSQKEIKEYGINNILKHHVTINYFEDKKYKVIKRLIVDDKIVVNTKDVGFLPFLIFVFLGLISLAWTVWGLYILELAPDDIRMKYLKNHK